jgi:hypothetical protein
MFASETPERILRVERLGALLARLFADYWRTARIMDRVQFKNG